MAAFAGDLIAAGRVAGLRLMQPTAPQRERVRLTLLVWAGRRLSSITSGGRRAWHCIGVIVHRRSGRRRHIAA